MRIPSFTRPVADDGYAWWYLDARSDDGRHGLTVIFFLGSVFSPYYARARRRGPTAALEHCAVNVALYGQPARWAMTERTGASVTRSEAALRIGRSALAIDADELVATLDEVTVPWPSRLSGTLRVALPPGDTRAYPLDAAGRHAWQPIAPQTRIRVALDAPRLAWEGSAYVDSNRGDDALERGFRSWWWSRAHAPDGGTRIRYDVLERDGSHRRRTLAALPDGRVEERLERDPAAFGERLERLPPTRWFRVPRVTRLAEGDTVEAIETLEDTPFYARSRYREGRPGAWSEVVHESLELARFDTPATRLLLPFRAPRRARPVAPTAA